MGKHYRAQRAAVAVMRRGFRRRRRAVLKSSCMGTIPSMSPLGRTVATGLTDLVPKIVQSDGFAEVAAALARGESAAVDGAWGSSCALVAAALASGSDRTLLVVVRRPAEVDDFAADMLGFLG